MHAHCNCSASLITHQYPHLRTCTPYSKLDLLCQPHPHQSINTCRSVFIYDIPFLGVFFFGEAFFKAVILTGTGSLFLGLFVFSAVFFDFVCSLLLSVSFPLSFPFFSLAFFGDASAFLGEASTFFFFLGG